MRAPLHHYGRYYSGIGKRLSTTRGPAPVASPLQRNRHHRSSSTGPSSDSLKVIFSGIQPTGIPHLGNYLGALQKWVELQDEAIPGTKLIYSIVDLHALTIPHDPALLRERRQQTLAILLAVGLDPNRATIFYQSMVWISPGVSGHSKRRNQTLTTLRSRHIQN